MNLKQNNSVDVILIGYENQENLGLRSIMSYLLGQKYKVILIPFFPDFDAELINAIRDLHPALIGFSIIFQFSLENFRKLMHKLRLNGIQSHFTAGGHFPSLRPKETLELIPELDTIVRFEGELTISELLKYLEEPDKWTKIDGLAFRKNSDIIINPVRKLIDNLDSLPIVYRNKPKTLGFGIKMASMLASRGCFYNCSFCSIRQFYGSAEGKLRRTRSPKEVVKELVSLYKEYDIRFFSFQDDDFAARSVRQKAWIAEFLSEIDKADLSNIIRWKISCRVDDIEENVLLKMIEHGLMAIYLGVESGSESGLRALNKHVNVKQNIEAIDLIEQNKIALAIGFMLFDPSSTMKSVEENISFLENIGENGYFPINFCKMLPYAGTPIEKSLIHDGRLKGTLSNPDYDFLDPTLNWYAFLVQRIFTVRNFHSEGLAARLQQVDFESQLYSSLNNEKSIDRLKSEIKLLIKNSNKLASRTLRNLWDEVILHGPKKLIQEENKLLEIADVEWRGEMQFQMELDSILNQLKIEPRTAHALMDLNPQEEY